MAFTVIPNSSLLPGKPLSTDLMTQFRDNDLFLFDRQAGMILVEKKLVTGDVSLLTFAGLDGDTDEVYKLFGRIRVTGTAPVLTLEPNGVSSAQDSIIVENGVSIAGASPNALVLARGSAASDQLIIFESTFFAKSDPNSIATNRLLQTQYNAFQAAAVQQIPGHGGALWDEDAANITSLDVVTSIASDIRNGSTVALYKMRQV